MGRPLKENFTVKYYKPSPTFANYMKELLHFLRDEDKSSNAGEQKAGNLRRMKNYYLNEYIFPSMSNLIFFFEAIYEYRELQEEFEEDIKDLLMIKRINPTPSNYANVFVTLVDSMIYTKEGYKDNNFRIRLIHELQKIIRRRIQDLILKNFGHGNVQRYVNEDLERTEAWTEAISASVNDEYDFETPELTYFPEGVTSDKSSRRISEENREMERRKSWNNFCFGQKPPSRALNFDVKELLEN